MTLISRFRFLLAAILLTTAGSSFADSYSDTVELFRNAGASNAYFDNCYGYAIFPTIGKAGFVVGGAYGNGRVYVAGQHVGDTSMAQLNLGWQLGGQAYSQVIFFEDARAYEEFSTGEYTFGATASAVAITAGVSATAATSGGTAGASGGKKDALTTGSGYFKGMAVFTIAKGGLMYEASIGGQKFSFRPVGT